MLAIRRFYASGLRIRIAVPRHGRALGIGTTAWCIALANLFAGPARAQFNAMQVYGPASISCATYLDDQSLRINADG